MKITKKFWVMPRKAAVFTLACALASSGAQAKDLPRIASTSLCGDAYLLALAPERAAMLSWQSRDDVSRASASQKNLPQLWDSPEAVISAKAGHILFGPGEGGSSNAYLSQTSKLSHDLMWGEDFDAVAKNYAEIGASISAQNAAARETSELTERLEALNERAALRGRKYKVLYMSRAGGTAGPGTFVDAAITAAGGENAVKAPGWVTLDPEMLLALSPDFIVLSFMEDGYESANAKGLRHKVLRRFMNARPHVNIPGALWPCAGPGLIEAAERIADGLDGLE